MMEQQNQQVFFFLSFSFLCDRGPAGVRKGAVGRWVGGRGGIADKTDQIIRGVPIVFSGETHKPTCGVCKGQIYFNKTSELQPQFHFDEFPPAGVSQAVGGRAEKRERGAGRWGLRGR